MIGAVARGRTSSLATRPKFPFYVHSIKTLKVRRTAVITVDGKPAKLGEPLNLRKRRPEHARRRVPGENTSKKRLEQKKHQPHQSKHKNGGPSHALISLEPPFDCVPAFAKALAWQARQDWSHPAKSPRFVLEIGFSLAKRRKE